MGKIVTQLAVVDREKCIGCKTCVQICPVTAIELDKEKEKPKAIIDKKECQACTICITRCPEFAITLESRTTPLRIGLDLCKVSSDETAAICRNAHMYPDQIICYCQRIQAKEVAASILLGAKTPEQVAKMTGARTGCGVLCISSVIRLLKAAGLELKDAPGYQWHGDTVSIWDLPDEIMQKYDKDFFLLKDLENMDKIFPGSEGK